MSNIKLILFINNMVVEKYDIVESEVTSRSCGLEFGRLYDELGWEFVWEAHRRRDMIRFGLFTKRLVVT